MHTTLNMEVGARLLMRVPNWTIGTVGSGDEGWASIIISEESSQRREIWIGVVRFEM